MTEADNDKVTCPHCEKEIDHSPFLRFLQTKPGETLATKLIDLLDNLKQADILHTNRNRAWEYSLKFAAFVVVVGAVTWLSSGNKFTPELGVLFGTLVGYVYGKKTS